MFSCHSFVPNSSTNNNISEFCDRSIDDIAAVAHKLDATEPAKANAKWREVDKMVTDASPAIFMVSRKLNTLTSRRVSNYTRTLMGNLVFDQMWVQ